jgi:predicted DNA-binding protein (MmcQ/YjbR family)
VPDPLTRGGSSRKLSLFVREEFETFAKSLPGALIVHQWRDDSVAKVGGRIFALLDGEGPGKEIWFKASPLAFEMLTELEGVRPAPYFRRAQWVAVSPLAPLNDTELRAYLTEAHRLVVARLTRKLRAELGL